MKKPGTICSRCRKIKTPDCQICKSEQFKGFNTANYTFYNSYAWRQKSKSYRRSNPLCSSCLEKGRTSPSEVTDHIIPIDKGGAKWDENNFMALCHSCHNSKSGKSARSK